jgi:hypothetical protein
VIEFPSAGPEQGLICLEVSSTCMKPQNAHEHVLVVGQIRHRFDILDMSQGRAVGGLGPFASPLVPGFCKIWDQPKTNN